KYKRANHVTYHNISTSQDFTHTQHYALPISAIEGDCIRQVVYPRPHRHCPSYGSRSCSYWTWIYDYCGLYSNVEVPFQCLSGWSSYNRQIGRASCRERV